MKRVKLYNENNLEALKKLPNNSVDSVVTDPPYGLSFMNKKWDYDVPSVEFWKEVFRVLKPGGHVLSFGGTRTYHRMVVNMEDAGFEIRDQIMWIYGSGFPKSHNIGKSGSSEFEGWGTALKPANEPICLARKPLSEKSVAENVLKYKTGGINVDGCRIGTTDTYNYKNGPKGNSFSVGKEPDGKRTEPVEMNSEGRFPANIILECCCDEVIEGEKGEIKKIKSDGGNIENRIFGGGKGLGACETNSYTDKGDIHTNPECPCYIMDQQSGESKSSKQMMGSAQSGNDEGRYNWNNGEKNDFKSIRGHNDKGGASRFFYQAKVSKAERNMGLDGFDEKEQLGQEGKKKCSLCNLWNSSGDGRELCECIEPTWIRPQNKNTHPTVKPINLLTYLCRLVTPENGIVLDPFMGSGSTGIAAQLEGFRFVGMELEPEYFKIAESRIENWEKYKKFLK